MPAVIKKLRVTINAQVMTIKKAANCFQLIFNFMSAKVVVSARMAK